MYTINSDFNVIFKAISYKTRTDILKLISKKSNLYLTDLAKKLKMKKQTLEFHLRILKNIGLISSKRKEGKVFLSYNKNKVSKCFDDFNKYMS
ncbi:MAG: ArsR family transcriptional regulator [Alphaproteobacteria bacterium]|nr:MAG: hypothetical protein B6I23_00670 [Rickettsiaceae bacterium 4572_127]